MIRKRGNIAVLNHIPINNLQQRTQMGSAFVLVVQIIGVLPNVEGGERLEGTIQLGMTSV